MKTLYLMRHAKSSWDDLNLSDFERPLNARGNRDAPVMAERMAAKSPQPQLVYASTAERVRQTILQVARAMAYPEADIVWKREIYEGGVEVVMGLLESTDDSIETVMVAGHNPTMSWCVSHWSNGFGHHFPTAGIACLRVQADSWADVAASPGELVEFDYPKKDV